MAKIYRKSDRISVQIDEVQIKIAPLSNYEKAQVQQCLFKGVGGSIPEGSRGIFLALKYAIKEVKGIEDSNGQPYELRFEQDGSLEDDCVDDLLNTSFMRKLSLVCSSLATNVPDEFTGPDNKPLEGVRILRQGDAEKNA